MSKALRLSEKWYRRGLWLVAFVFAGFLIGLGGTVVGDLPRVEQEISLDDFIDPAQSQPLRDQVESAQAAANQAQAELEQAQLKLQAARNEVASAQQGLSAWLATRRATERADQDPELIERNRALDRLRQSEQAAQAAVQRQQQIALDARQAQARASAALAELQSSASGRYADAQHQAELRVFLYRLALTLPLLALAAWLFVRKRHGTWWPFVWGFILFALFAFFVELVPYLPSYGGYVRYIVGIVITVLIGRYAILALNRYLERQRAAEALPDAQRREELPYDTALARLAKGVCPGCERPVDLKDKAIDFCPHCGIGLHEPCGVCNTRRSAFARFCHACGAPAARRADRAQPDGAPPPVRGGLDAA